MKDSKFIEAYLKIINEGADDVPEMNDNQGGEEVGGEEAPLKKVTFLTSDATLIDALNSGFQEVVFFVNAKDENGEDTVEEVKFKADSFGSVEVTDAEEGEGEGDDQVDEGDDAQLDEGGDAQLDEGDDAQLDEGDDTQVDEGDDTQVDEGDDAQLDECGECGCEPSEWLEDGVCLKCGSSECDGTCEGSPAFQKMSAMEDGDDEEEGKPEQTDECGDGGGEAVEDEGDGGDDA